MIRSAVLKRPEAVVEVSVHLWESLASELIAVFGEGGFQSLYSRSLYLTKMNFFWMPSHPLKRIDLRFADLKACFETRNVAEVGEANIALLITFIDTLAGLIGEPLTASILSAAWGNDTLNRASKEQQS